MERSARRTSSASRCSERGEVFQRSRYDHLFPDELDSVADRLDVAAARAAEDLLGTRAEGDVVELRLAAP